jgi:ABC-type transport system involved in multi-copper enzyme maturation permease subunit
MIDPVPSDMKTAPAVRPAPATGNRTRLAPPPPRAQASWLIARREIVDLLSDWRIIGPALLLVVVFPLLLVIMSAQGHDFLIRRISPDAFTNLVPFALMLVGFFPVSFSLMIALESFAGEKERNTLEALLSTPLSDRTLYLGKLLAALIPPLVASYISMSLYLGGVMLVTGYRPDWSLIGAIVLLDLAQALVMVGSALIISSHTTSVRAANLLAAFIILPMSVLIQGNNALILWGGGEQLWLIALALGLFALLLIRMGLRLFNREQILAREMDDLRPSRLALTFRQFWALPPRAALQLRAVPAAAPPVAPARPAGLGRLYRRDIPVLLRLRWPDLALVACALLFALALGWALAERYPITTSTLINAASSRGAAGGPLGLLGSVAADDSGVLGLLGGVVSGVLRVVLLSAFLIVLGVRSFGTLPVLFMMLGAGATGFVLGQLALAGTSPLVLGITLLFPPVLFPALALLLLTAFAARFGLVVAAPPRGFSLGDSLLLALAEYLKICLLAVPLLLLGGLLQSLLLALAQVVR